MIYHAYERGKEFGGTGRHHLFRGLAPDCRVRGVQEGLGLVDSPRLLLHPQKHFGLQEEELGSASAPKDDLGLDVAGTAAMYFDHRGVWA